MQSEQAARERDSMDTENPSPAHEAQQVIDTETTCHQAEPREPAFLIAMSWWNAWTNYSGFTLQQGDTAVVRQREESELQPPRPPAIDNNSLVLYQGAQEKKLKPGLVEGTHYKLVFESTWKLLHQWYDGEPAFVRQWVGGTQPFVEVYALQLTIRRSSDSKEGQLFITREAKKSDLKTKACQLLDLKEEDVRMWDFYMSELYANMEDQLDDGVTGPGNALTDKQHVLLEEKDASGSFVMKKKQPPVISNQLVLRPGRNFPPPSDTSFDAHGRGHGLAGLSNLGNTCFMNSSIQSLAHTVPLMRKFLRRKYELDINKDNPLGMNGELAEAFGSLMDKLWKGDTASVSPSSFKYQLGKFAPQFQGYGQQDSQELLAFLLDGLHEDLNRIKRKPCIEEKDADGRPDAEVAKEAWDNYRKRNDSTIVDHFQGLYKSTLICPMDDCQFHSIKFDPFMYLSLPLPDRRTRNFEVTVIHVDGSKVPTRYSVAVPITGKVRDLYKALAKVLGLPSEDPQKLLLLAEYDSRHTLSMHSEGSEALSTVGTTNGGGFYSSSKPLLLAYHYASSDQGPSSGKQLLVYHRQRQKRLRIFPGGEDFADKFAPPLVLFMAEDQLQQLREHTRQVEIANAPSWKHFEYVLESDSGINAMLETALRPFKRPRHDGAKEHINDSGEGRMVRSRLASPTDSDSTMADAATGDAFALEAANHSLGLPNGMSSQHLSGSQGTREPTNDDGKSVNGHMGAEEGLGSTTPGANGFTIGSHSQNGVSDKAAGGTQQVPADGRSIDSDNQRQEPSADSLHVNGGDPSGAAGEAIGMGVANGEKLEGPPLKRMSWMEAEPSSADGYANGASDGQANGEVNGQANGAADGEVQANGDADGAVAEWIADWEDVPDVKERRPSSPVMFPMDSDHDGASQGTSPPAPVSLPLPPGLKAQPVIPPVQPFNMFANQQAQEADTGGEPLEEGESRPEPEEGDKETPPYTLKCANHLGDVRLQNCPSHEEQKVLYFTAQWEHDGGGVYDVAKFTQPEEDESVKLASGVASTSAREAVGLDACLQAFQTAEELEASDSWFCSKCKRHVQANKKLDLWAVPEVLVVHLKRFFFTRARRDKLDVQVEFPLEDWDLSNYLPHHQDVPPVYDLYAVSNHFGGMGGGHYNAYCKMPDGKWWCFDDSHVHAVDKDKICSSSAYVLFYRRRHEAQQDTGDLLRDIMKSDPEDADTVMSDAGNENNFARANHGDSPEWTTRHFIQATPLQLDTATHDINTDGTEEGEYMGQNEGAVSGIDLFPAADGGDVFHMEDTPQPSSAADHVGPSVSDVSMRAASHGASADAANTEIMPSVPSEGGTTSSYHMDGPPMDFGHGSAPAAGEALALESRAKADASCAAGDKASAEEQAENKSGDWVLPDKLGRDVGDEAGEADAASNEADASEGGRSEPGDLQDLSDYDFVKKDVYPDISSGYEEV